jgi:hypothetical protein
MGSSTSPRISGSGVGMSINDGRVQTFGRSYSDFLVETPVHIFNYYSQL